MGERGEGVGGEQQNAEQKQRAGRDHAFGRRSKGLEQHGAAHQKRQHHQPPDQVASTAMVSALGSSRPRTSDMPSLPATISNRRTESRAALRMRRGFRSGRTWV